jgi:ATP-dependent DNA helicase RecG
MPVRGTSPNYLDYDKVANHIAEAVKNGQYRGPTDPHTYLLQGRMLVPFDGETFATMAGILCFGRNPQELFPRAVVDIGHYRGTETLSYEVVHLEKDIGGTIFDQLARVETYLWTNTHHGMTLTEGTLQRKPVHEYPQPVIRELIVNMLAHRNYTDYHSAARVQLFRNRIEWVSPGGLPPGITVDNILTSQASRNPVVLSALYLQGYGEAVGQGLDTVVKVLKNEGLPPPRFEDTGASFMVTVQGRAVEQFGSDTSYARLNERQRRILSALRAQNALTPREITALFPLDTTQRTIQRDLRELMEADLVVSEGKGRAVRYRLGGSA